MLSHTEEVCLWRLWDSWGQLSQTVDDEIMKSKTEMITRRGTGHAKIRSYVSCPRKKGPWPHWIGSYALVRYGTLHSIGSYVTVRYCTLHWIRSYALLRYIQLALSFFLQCVAIFKTINQQIRWHDNRFEVNWHPKPTLVLSWILKFFLFGALPIDTLKIKHTKSWKKSLLDIF